MSNYNGVQVTTPFDPTGYSQISGAQLLQYVAGVKVDAGANLGLFIKTTDNSNGTPVVPDANTYPELQLFGWVRESGDVCVLYLWNDNIQASGTFQKWLSVNQSQAGNGALLQRYAQQTNAVQPSNTVLAEGTLPTTANTQIITGFGTAGVVSFTPVSATSTFEVLCIIPVNNNNGKASLGLFINGILVDTDVEINTGGTGTSSKATLRAIFKPGINSTFTVQVGFAITIAGTVIVGQNAAATMTITETQ